MGLIVSWLILTFGILIAGAMLKGVQVNGFWGAVLVAAIFGTLNFLIGWLFFVAIGIVTLGIGFLLAFITRLFVNAIMLKITDAMSRSITIRGFGNALLAALIMGGVGIIADWVLRMS